MNDGTVINVVAKLMVMIVDEPLFRGVLNCLCGFVGSLITGWNKSKFCDI